MRLAEQQSTGRNRTFFTHPENRDQHAMVFAVTQARLCSDADCSISCQDGSRK